MPLYVIERTFAEQLELTSDDVRLIDEINADEGVRWLFSFLSADRRRTYCLYEAPSPEAIVAAARRANIPADAVVEVGPAAPALGRGCATGPGRRRAPRARACPRCRPAPAQQVLGVDAVLGQEVSVALGIDLVRELALRLIGLPAADPVADELDDLLLGNLHARGAVHSLAAMKRSESYAVRKLSARSRRRPVADLRVSAL